MVDFILNSQGLVAYLLVLLALLAGSLGAPLPEDLALLAAGILAGLSHVHPILMGIVCYVGILLGDLIIYRIGWLAGPALFRKRWFRKHLTTERLHYLRTNLERRTVLTILIARHLFYVRTATFLICGAVRLSLTRFLIIDAFAALVTVPIMMGLGYFFANNYHDIIDGIQRVKYVLVLLGIIAFTLLIWRYRRYNALQSHHSTKDSTQDT